MFEIKSEKGFALLNTLIFIMFLGLIAMTLARLVSADAQMQAYYMNEKRAFYAAESGIEYALKGLELTAYMYNSISGLNNVTETINTGGGTQCQITYRTYGLDSLHITAVGQSGGYGKAIEKGFRYIDVSAYGIYAGGSVTNLWSDAPIMSNAPRMPFFDLNELRNMAIPTRYFPGNLTLNFMFNFPWPNLVFVENNLVINFNFISQGYFVAGNSVTINPFLLWSISSGVICLPNPGSTFTSNPGWVFVVRNTGGLIVNGNATCPSSFWSRYRVIYSRNRINNLLSRTVNEGPLIYWNPSWSQR